MANVKSERRPIKAQIANKMWRFMVSALLLELCNPTLQLETLDVTRHSKMWLNTALGETVPPLDATKEPASRGPGSGSSGSSADFGEHANLKWVPWNGSLPDGAVAIFNGYVQRTDYVCKVKCEAGFLTHDACRYPYADEEFQSTSFDVLVNVDHFEFLEWVEDSYGSVPPHAVETCDGVDIFVGKNKYGLGKVVSQHEAFFLPWEGEEYWYKNYQVLRVNPDVYSQHISHVEYAVDQMELFYHPPETLQLAKVTNLECHAVQKTVTLEKTSASEKTWDTGRQLRNGTVSTMKAKVPILGPGNVDFTEERMVTFSEGTGLLESISHSVSVELLVPPGFSCAVRMDGRKMSADIPFKARLSRTNHDGDTHWTSITGTYDGVGVGEINAVVERCQPVEDVVPCQANWN